MVDAELDHTIRLRLYVVVYMKERVKNYCYTTMAYTITVLVQHSFHRVVL
jgi:hypothetical protein